MTARREFGLAIAACVAGAGLVLLTLRGGWARVVYSAPSPLPSGSVAVTGQNLLPAAGGLALAALACLAAVIATRGLARRLAGLVMAGLGGWIAWVVSAPVHAAAVVAAAAGQAASAEFAGGSLPGGNSAISGGGGAAGGLPAIGAASHVVLATVPWRSAAAAGAAVVIVMGLATAWRGPGWPVMSARFDRQAAPGAADGPAASEVPVASEAPAASEAPVASEVQADRPGAGPEIPGGGAAAPPAAPAGQADEAYGEEDTAALWEALDRGVDLTDASG